MRSIFFLMACCLTLPVFADELIIEPDAGPAPVLSAIAQANSSVELVMYGLSDQDFTQALIDSKNHGTNVAILLEPHPYKNQDQNNKSIHALEQAAIHLRWPSDSFQLLHQKTLVLDHKTAIVMTFNFTYATFKHERNFALILTDKNRVHDIENVFLADSAHKKIAVNNPDLVWSPDNAREKILTLIHSAKSNIDIYAEDVSDFQVIGALATAARQGVHVKLLLSANPRKFNNGKFTFLKKAGVLIHNSDEFEIHAKVIMIDGKRALVGSINLTQPSIDENRELSVVTVDPAVVALLEKTFEHDWKN